MLTGYSPSATVAVCYYNILDLRPKPETRSLGLLLTSGVATQAQVRRTTFILINDLMIG